MENTQTNWLSENYPKLRPYAGQYIAHDEPRLIASNYSILLLWAELKSLKVNSFSIYYVPKEFDSPQINMFKLLPVSKSEWKPVKPFRLRLGSTRQPCSTNLTSNSGKPIGKLNSNCASRWPEIITAAAPAALPSNPRLAARPCKSPQALSPLAHRAHSTPTRCGPARHLFFVKKSFFPVNQ
jgi:hypothetical protein